MRVVLVGQAPGPRTRPELPLFPLPSTSAGGRLAKLFGMSRTQYLRAFTRVNLIHEFPGRHKRDDKFPMRDARNSANVMRPLLEGQTVIMVGRKVAEAFGFGHVSFFEWIDCPRGEFRFAVIPHPSGRNHFYNSAENVSRCQEFLRRVTEIINGRE